MNILKPVAPTLYNPLHKIASPDLSVICPGFNAIENLAPASAGRADLAHTVEAG